MRPLRNALIVVAALSAAAAGFAAAEPFTVDTSHSHIEFSVRHLGISNVRGEFKDYNVNLLIDTESLPTSSVELAIAAKSIDTGVDRRDGHLRSSDFLDIDNHPEITFKSKSIRAKGDGEFEVTGDLTIRGVTRQVVMPVTLAGPIKDMGGNARVGIEGSLTINRQDYGVSWNRLLDSGGVVVSDEVKISFELEASHEAAAPPAGR